MSISCWRSGHCLSHGLIRRRSDDTSSSIIQDPTDSGKSIGVEPHSGPFADNANSPAFIPRLLGAIIMPPSCPCRGSAQSTVNRQAVHFVPTHGDAVLLKSSFQTSRRPSPEVNGRTFSTVRTGTFLHIRYKNRVYIHVQFAVRRGHPYSSVCHRPISLRLSMQLGNGNHVVISARQRRHKHHRGKSPQTIVSSSIRSFFDGKEPSSQ